MRIGILTGGGDAPGLNAVIRAFVRRAVREHSWDIVGIEDSFDGLLCTPRRVVTLDKRRVSGLLHLGGTLLGTTNRGDPFAYPTALGPRDRSVELGEIVRAEGLAGLVIVGGDGTQRIGWRLMQEVGVPVVGIPKTIDNDLSGTDRTFGFQSAIDIATDALDRLHTTAESHQRVMFLEVMGRDAGHIALHAGLSGGADVILIPEIPYDPEAVAAKIHRRQRTGKSFTVVIVAEGALPITSDKTPLSSAQRSARLKRGRGAAAIAMAQLDGRIQAEMRATVLGHIQRGGSPVPFDRLLATRFGAAAVDLVRDGRWGRMVCLRAGEIESLPLADAVDTRLVDPNGHLVRLARQLGVELGRGLSLPPNLGD